MSQHTASLSRPVLALDLGDRRTVLARREGDAIVHEELATSRETLRDRLQDLAPCRVVFEAGSQSHWVAWLLEALGHEPIVVHPRRLRMSTESSRKTDRADAEWLLRLGEVDLGILSPVKLRSRRRQADLALLRVRKSLTHMRTQAVQAVRSHAKLFGCALPAGGPHVFPKRARAGLDPELRSVCEPLLRQVERLSRELRAIDARLEQLAARRYPETALLCQVPSVGPLTALSYVLTLQAPERFARSRDAGSATGLVPRKHASGARDPELGITKAGDGELRRLLVLAAHRSLRKIAPDSDLKRAGLRLAARGGKNAKKRAVVATARKLAVLLMALWKSGEVYEPLRQAAIAEPLDCAA